MLLANLMRRTKVADQVNLRREKYFTIKRERGMPLDISYLVFTWHESRAD